MDVQTSCVVRLTLQRDDFLVRVHDSGVGRDCRAGSLVTVTKQVNRDMSTYSADG